jgi:GT2 family glycosyltransferase
MLRAATTDFLLTVVSQRNGGPAAARNAGVASAQSDVIVFIDDDIVPGPELVERHLSWHRDSNSDGLVVIGPMLNPPDRALSAIVQWEQDKLYKQYAAMDRGHYAPTYRQFFTGNASLARRSVLEVGGFDPRFRRAEDIEMARRLDAAGARFVFDRRITAHHYADRSYEAWLDNARAYGINDIEFSRGPLLEGLLHRTKHEFLGRHPLVRALTRTCLRWEAVERLAQPTLRGAGQALAAARARGATSAVLSAAYNVAYYSGMQKALGSRPDLLETLSG